MNKGILILIIGAICLFSAIYFTNNAYSDGSFNIFPVKSGDYKTFKVFENGVTYKTYKEGWYAHEVVNILFEGQEYHCQPDGYHDNQYLNPICVEIIMRSIP